MQCIVDGQAITGKNTHLIRSFLLGIQDWGPNAARARQTLMKPYNEF
jgi:hypothetical protein